MLWVEGYKESTLSQRREDLIVESDSSMNQTLNYGLNYSVHKFQPDQLPDLKLEDCISSNAKIEGKHCPPDCQIRKTEDSVTFYKITRLCLMSENFQLFLKQPTSTKICV